MYAPQDVDKLRHAVGLKAYSSQQPLEEFRLEANRAFLVLLDSYRDAVVSRLMVPDLNFSLLLNHEELIADSGIHQHEYSAQRTAQDVQQPLMQPQKAANGSAGGNGVRGHGDLDTNMLQPLSMKKRQT